LAVGKLTAEIGAQTVERRPNRKTHGKENRSRDRAHRDCTQGRISIEKVPGAWNRA
jgi:hypothetical protein